MDFPIRQIGDVNLHFYESHVDSDVQLVFVPGGLNPELWKNQLRYFSKNYKVVSFRPTVSYRDYNGEKRALEAVLDRSDLDNVILVSNIFGGSLIQDFENRDNVKATVVSGIKQDFEKFVPRSIFNISCKIGLLEPKLVKKYFFCDLTEYTVVKEFLEDFKQPKYENFLTFLEKYRFDNPSKSCLILHSENNFLSDLNYARRLESSVSVLNGCGVFSFYEKPQEFNKALLDFLQNEREYNNSPNWDKIKNNNMSLKDFESKKKSMREKRERKARQLLEIKTKQKR